MLFNFFGYLVVQGFGFTDELSLFHVELSAFSTGCSAFVVNLGYFSAIVAFAGGVDYHVTGYCFITNATAQVA